MLNSVKVSEVIAGLTELLSEHGDLEVSTGGPEGDGVEQVWFDGTCGDPVIYVG